MTRAQTDLEAAFAPLVDEAIAARHAGDFERAIGLCDEILKNASGEGLHRIRAVTHAELAGVYLFGKKMPKDAEHHYREASTISPRSEFYSLGLFHALADQGRWSDALTEMCRFLEQRTSAEYVELVNGINDSALPSAEDRQLASRARDLVARWTQELPNPPTEDC